MCARVHQRKIVFDLVFFFFALPPSHITSTQIQMLGWSSAKNLTGDGGIKKLIVSKGEGEKPKPGSTVTGERCDV